MALPVPKRRCVIEKRRCDGIFLLLLVFFLVDIGLRLTYKEIFGRRTEPKAESVALVHISVFSLD